MMLESYGAIFRFVLTLSDIMGYIGPMVTFDLAVICDHLTRNEVLTNNCHNGYEKCGLCPTSEGYVSSLFNEKREVSPIK